MLLQQLREEAKEAEEMRMRNARKLCEEASTKLLLPMIMLLLVVMILIMFPAFSNVISDDCGYYSHQRQCAPIPSCHSCRT